MHKLFGLVRKTRFIWGFLLVWAISFIFRDAVVERDLRALEQATGEKFAPFLVESSIMYSYIEQAADGKDIAGVDPALPAMKNLPVSEQMSLGLEYAGGWLLKFRRWLTEAPEPPGKWETSYTESRFIRRMLSIYLAAVPALIFLLLVILHTPWCLAVLGALISGFSAAALGRYTGQDLIKGAFALPLLISYILLAQYNLRAAVKLRKYALFGVMITAFLAAACWDASQLVIGLLALVEIGRCLVTNRNSAKQCYLYLATYLSFVLAALLVPYSRAHGAFFSPVITFILPSAWLLNCAASVNRRRKFLYLVLLSVYAVLAVKYSPFGSNYSHFGELITAKLRFLNSLPKTPEVLTFDQRFLWTPELHSADWLLTKMIFPAGLWALFISYPALLIYNLANRKKPLKLPAVNLFVMLTVIGFIAYIFFARFRDITGWMMAVALTLLWSEFARRTSQNWRWLWVLFLCLIAITEICNSWKLRRRYPDGLTATSALIGHLRQYDFTGRTVLTDMQNSPLMKCYVKSSIIIQPKYELPAVRQAMQHYLETFFNQPTAEFSRFCQRHQIDYVLVHVPMVTTPASVRYSYRYMSCTHQLRKDSAAVQLGLSRRNNGDFFEMPLPAAASGMGGYRLYKFISPEDRAKAKELTTSALEAYYLGKHRRARRLIRQAFRLAPDMSKQYESYLTIIRNPLNVEQIDKLLMPPRRALIRR